MTFKCFNDKYFCSFRDGNYCTKFIGEEYPKGFHNVDLSEKEKLQLLATSVALDQVKHDHNGLYNPRLTARSVAGLENHNDDNHIVASLEGHNYAVTSSVEESGELAVKIVPLDEHNKPIKSKRI
jgi:hypothetical protein